MIDSLERRAHGANIDASSNALARRTLIVTAILCISGSGLGCIGILRGTVAGLEIGLVLSCMLFGSAALTALTVWRTAALQTVATAFTIYLTIYLCTGVVIAATGNGEHLNVFIYLVWFFPLLAFNKLVNARAIGNILGRCIVYAPVLTVACLFPRLIGLFDIELSFLVVAFGLSYAGYGFMLNTVTRYREEYIIERERAESRKVESDLLESISDCFISLDRQSRLVYLNDAACTEFGIGRQAALNRTIASAVPGFFSAVALTQLLTASQQADATVFEAQNDTRDAWFEMRCFPRSDGLSIYFRNITESMSSRRKLDEANRSLREHAELLDRAGDAILVQDMTGRIIYWNKGAERLYGWTNQEVIGRLIAEVVPDGERERIVAGVLQTGEWSGERSQRSRDGRILIVESRCTLARAQDDTPRSILSINTNVTNRKAAEERVAHLAFYDVLTELPNRVLLRERVNAALARAVRDGTGGALLFIDLDDFKTLNDTRGHEFGDLLLQQVAYRLTSCVRTSDTVARLGGDEFVVMLEGFDRQPGATAPEVAAVAQKILAALRAPYQLAHCEHASTASIGITLFPATTADTADDVLKRADLAMYQAKAQGRNSMCFFDPAMQLFVAARAELQSDLRRALQNEEFVLHYQPQIDRDGRVTGAEALLRWQHPRRGMVPPNEFIPLAEEAGLIVEVGRWVLETACAQMARWSRYPAMEALTIAVNVSMLQFLDPNFVDLVLDVLRASGADPRRLKLEITESFMMENVDATIAKMTALKARQVGFSLDDFGTGYSSLSHLRRLPLDQLKIDRSFVNDVLTDEKDASIARTIITLGRSLNLSVIAEGVETQGQRAFLAGEGCDCYQGFLFSPAVTAQGLEFYVDQARSGGLPASA